MCCVTIRDLAWVEAFIADTPSIKQKIYIVLKTVRILFSKLAFVYQRFFVIVVFCSNKSVKIQIEGFLCTFKFSTRRHCSYNKNFTNQFYENFITVKRFKFFEKLLLRKKRLK